MLIETLTVLREGIIIHQNEHITNCACIQPYMGVDDLYNRSASVKDNEVSTTIPADSTPDHY